MNTSALFTASGIRRQVVVLFALCLCSGMASAVNLCLDKKTNKKVMTEGPCEQMTTLKTTGDAPAKTASAEHPSQSQARRDRCKILIQKASSPVKARAYADLCTKPLDDKEFAECSAQIEYSNSPTKIAASVASCTNDIAASKRIAPPPVTVNIGTH